MAKKPVMQIVTANHLLGGHSVYLSPGGWTPDHRLARIAVGAEEAADLEAEGRAGEDANLVVGVYLVDVELDADNDPQPTHYREKLRVRATPSFWPDQPVLATARTVRRPTEPSHVSL